jgi:galactokinase
VPSPTQAARASFSSAFGHEPTIVVLAPGRVELLGNHTDYNGGLVLAAAIDRFTAVAGRPKSDLEATIRSVDFAEDDRFPLDASLAVGKSGSWQRYVRGVTWAAQTEAGQFFRSGFESAIAGNVPRGAGLGSSASLQTALGMFLFEAGLIWTRHGPVSVDRLALAKMLQRGENGFVGVASGLLDQFSVLFARAGSALFLDCRDFSFEHVDLGANPPSIVVCDSKTSRSLADGMYNLRRDECQRVVTFFQAKRGRDPVKWLRDVSLGDLDSSWNDLDPVARRRARHVLTENERVRQGAEALRGGDFATLGRLMSASHASSRDDFENSSEALDALIEAAQSSPGFLGGKLSGGGWAGCTVNLVAADQATAFAESVREHYARRTGIPAEVHIFQTADGASVVTDDAR